MMKFKAILRSAVAVAMVLTAICSCDKQKNLSKDLPGCWELTGTSMKLDQKMEIYMEFATDGTFTLFQRLGTNTSFVRYEGSWTLSGDQLNGRYSDGSPWASAYRIDISDGILFMSSSSEESTYRSISSIPEDIQISNR